MSVISLIVFIAIIGLICWAITSFVPMDARFKNLIVVVGIVVAALYTLSAFGLLGVSPIVPRIR